MRRFGACLMCISLDCPAQRLERLKYWTSREALDIEGLGSELISSLVANHLVSDVADFYHLTTFDIASLPTSRTTSDGKVSHVGKKIAEKIILAIEESKRSSFKRFINGFGIPGVGKNMAGELAKAFPDIDLLSSATQEQLEAVDGIGSVLAQSIVDFFNNNENIIVIERLKSLGCKMKDDDITNSEPQILAGKRFVLTGTFTKLGLSRDEATEKLKNLGAKVSSSVSKNTSFVIAGDNPGSKVEKANEIGIPTLDEDDLISIIENKTFIDS